MKEEREEPLPNENQETVPSRSPEISDQPEQSNRREVIERYAKYAIVGAPLLVFVSKARAIHSRP
jgi:hypothetical protein